MGASILQMLPSSFTNTVEQWLRTLLWLEINDSRTLQSPNVSSNLVHSLHVPKVFHLRSVQREICQEQTEMHLSTYFCNPTRILKRLTWTFWVGLIPTIVPDIPCRQTWPYSWDRPFGGIHYCMKRIILSQKSKQCSPTKQCMSLLMCALSSQ